MTTKIHGNEKERNAEMSIKITEALFIRDKYEKKVVTPFDMDKQSYKETYRGFLLCPHPNCNAHLVYVSGDIQVSHFRTWRKSKIESEDISKSNHIEGCTNRIEYEESEKQRRKNDPNYKYRISDEHISAVLRRAFDAYRKGTSQILYGTSTDTKGNKVTPLNPEFFPNGRAALFGEGEEITSGREPKVPVRFIENLDEKDYVQVRCIIGEISNMQISDGYAYINLKTKKGITAKIYFNESFVVNNRPQFELFVFVKEYIDKLRESNQEIICCCIGEVTKVDSGFNVRPDRYAAFSINNRKLYAIYHELHGFKI